MSNYISVANLNNNTIWTKQLTNEEYHQVEKTPQGKDTMGFVSELVKPTRSNTWRNLATDLFLPLTLNHARKVQNIAGLIFAILSSLIIDTLTLPIRLITCIPRMYLNSKAEETPLHAFLSNQGADKELLASDYVHVKIEKIVSDEIKLWKKFHVNFVEVPNYPGSQVKCVGLVTEEEQLDHKSDKELYEWASQCNRPMTIFVPTLGDIA